MLTSASIQVCTTHTAPRHNALPPRHRAQAGVPSPVYPTTPPAGAQGLSQSIQNLLPCPLSPCPLAPGVRWHPRPALLTLVYIPCTPRLFLVAAAAYVARMFGITAGFHRLLSHRSVARRTYLILGDVRSRTALGAYSSPLHSQSLISPCIHAALCDGYSGSVLLFRGVPWFACVIIPAAGPSRRAAPCSCCWPPWGALRSKGGPCWWASQHRHHHR